MMKQNKNEMKNKKENNLKTWKKNGRKKIYKENGRKEVKFRQIMEKSIKEENL